MKKPAPLTRRFAALLVDYLVIVVYAAALFGCSMLFYHFAFGGVPNVLEIVGRGVSQLIGIVTLTLPIALYFYFTESSARHATFGKRAVKLRVDSIRGTIGHRQIALRTVIKLLPWEFAHTFVYQVVYYSQNNGTPPGWVMAGLIVANLLPVIYILTIVVRRDHRGPHDLAAYTIVVRD